MRILYVKYMHFSHRYDKIDVLYCKGVFSMPLTIEIHLLGEFCLKVDGCDTQLSAHSYQLWNLLGYLIVFRRREIPHYELI